MVSRSFYLQPPQLSRRPGPSLGPDSGAGPALARAGPGLGLGWARREGAAAASRGPGPAASRACTSVAPGPAQRDGSVRRLCRPCSRCSPEDRLQTAGTVRPGPRSPRPPTRPSPSGACTTRPRAVTGLPGCVSTSCLAPRQGPGVGAQRARLRGARARGNGSRRHFDREARARHARRRACPTFPWQRGARPGGQEQGMGDQRALEGGTTEHPPSVLLSGLPGRGKRRRKTAHP